VKITQNITATYPDLITDTEHFDIAQETGKRRPAHLNELYTLCAQAQCL
jgi:hypothetical protein